MAEQAKKLSERVVTEILEMITLQKRFLPGDKLPNENDLCAEMGVSRTTLREAIQKLSMQNILEVRRGKGTFVVDNSKITARDVFANMTYTGMSLKDLYEIRLILEPQTAFFAAQRATSSEINQILTYGKILEEKLHKGENCIEINRLFHNSIAFSSHNTLLVRLVSIINGEMVRMFAEMNIKQILHRHTLSDHSLILHYLELRDAAGARAAMELHMLHSMQDYNFE